MGKLTNEGKTVGTESGRRRRSKGRRGRGGEECWRVSRGEARGGLGKGRKMAHNAGRCRRERYASKDVGCESGTWCMAGHSGLEGNESLVARWQTKHGGRTRARGHRGTGFGRAGNVRAGKAARVWRRWFLREETHRSRQSLGHQGGMTYTGQRLRWRRERGSQRIANAPPLCQSVRTMRIIRTPQAPEWVDSLGLQLFI